MNDDQNIEIIINQVRGRLIDSMLLITAFLAPPAVVISLYRIQHTGWQNSLITHIIAAIVMLLLFIYRRKMPTKIKALIILSFVFILMVTGYLNYGLSGNSSGYFILLPVLSTLFFGIISGLASLAISVISISIICFTVLHYLIIFDIDFNAYNYAPSSWAITIFLIILFGGIVITVAHQLYISLIESLRE